MTNTPDLTPKFDPVPRQDLTMPPPAGYVPREDYAALSAERGALKAELAEAVEVIVECREEIDDYIRHEYPHDHPVQERYRERDFAANPARAFLARHQKETGT